MQGMPEPAAASLQHLWELPSPPSKDPGRGGGCCRKTLALAVTDPGLCWRRPERGRAEPNPVLDTNCLPGAAEVHSEGAVSADLGHTLSPPTGPHSLRARADALGNPVSAVPSLRAVYHRWQGRKEELFQSLCWIQSAFATWGGSEEDLGCQELGHTPHHAIPSLPQSPQ